MIQQTRPWILLTNDDGVDAHGLAMPEQAVTPIGEVYVVPPKEKRSGASPPNPFPRGLRCEEVGERRFALDGTPADCVIAALSHVLGFPPALVISGINHGGNMGRNIHYSGTVGAASEGALHGIRAIAMSLAGKPPADFAPAATLAASLAQRLLHTRFPEGAILNVNVPTSWTPDGEVRATHAYRRYSRTIMNELDEREGLWVREYVDWESAPSDSDLRAVTEGAASVSLVRVYEAPELEPRFDLTEFISTLGR